MSLIQYHKESRLRDPVVVVAFGGWNDAAESATTAIRFLIDRWRPAKLAEIDGEEFFVYTETRPTVKLLDGIQRTIVWPSNQFFGLATPELPYDVILFIGVEPQLKWKQFSNLFLEVCRHYYASEVVFLGALLADIPHSAPVPISGTSTNADVKERLREMDLHASRYEGPTGIVGVLSDACRNAQIPSASFWAAAPHYLVATPNVKVTAALLTYLNTYLSFELDLSGIQSDALHFEEKITNLVARDPEVSAYVRKLEEQLGAREDDDEEEKTPNNPDITYSTGPLPSADRLIQDVEELLRQERKNGPADADENDDDDGDGENA
jgi:proteasome assembly chaperone (PAC2) family protein